MTQKNLYLMENKKPVELVQELKSEIPTYEEFIRNYESDDLVSVSYVNEFNANAELGKGYGPCDVCKEPEVTVEFKFGCPGCSNSSPSSWHHVRSGCESSRMLITNKGWLSCGGCGTGYIMSNWRFSCSGHPGDYRKMSEECWNESMARALMLANTNRAIKRLSMYVASHPDKFGF